MAAALQEIYRSVNAVEAEQRLSQFEQSELAKKYKLIGPSWRRHWEEVIPFFEYPPQVRKMIYTTNVIESLHMQVRKVIKSRAIFLRRGGDGIDLPALRNIMKNWKVAASHWQGAMNQFAILFCFCCGARPAAKAKQTINQNPKHKTSDTSRGPGPA